MCYLCGRRRPLLQGCRQCCLGSTLSTVCIDKCIDICSATTHASGSRATMTHITSHVSAHVYAYVYTCLRPCLYTCLCTAGANYVKGAVIMPQQISMAASFDRAMAERFGFITGRDTRAAPPRRRTPAYHSGLLSAASAASGPGLLSSRLCERPDTADGDARPDGVPAARARW